MYDPRPEGSTLIGKLWAVCEKTMNQGPFRMAGPRMDHHSGSLVDHQKIIILEENIEGHRFGYQSSRCLDGGEVNSNSVTRTEFLTGLGQPAIDQHLACFDNGLERTAGIIDKLTTEKNIQSLLDINMLNGKEAIERQGGTVTLTQSTFSFRRFSQLFSHHHSENPLPS